MPLAVRWLVLAVVLLIPVRIVAQGYLPLDDALRHAAKAVSGRSWDQILVLRPDITVDSHPGWHWVLEALHRLTVIGAPALVLFSVIALFLVFSLGPVALLRRPEAWLLSLLVLGVTDPAVLSRLFMGRPFLVSGGVLAVILLLWPSLAARRTGWGALGLVTGLLAAATWIHASWYLFALPVVALFLAREWRAGARLLACLGAGVVAGAMLTGQPFAFLRQTLLHPLLALGGFEPQSTLAIEFRAHEGSPLFVMALLGMLGWRALRGQWRRCAVDNPVFLMATLGWVLGFVAKRFWADWGAPAALVWLALEFQDFLDTTGAGDAAKRLALAAAAGATCFLALTSDANGRWSAGDTTFLPLMRADAAPWLPDPGGILYSDEMRLFYQLFYRQPRAPWRYLVGFEPGLMPPEDLAVYRDILKARTAQAFAPWVRRMRPEDRLIIRSLGLGQPPIEGLEWHHLGGEIWSGRKSP